jgi:hypothetical protein
MSVNKKETGLKSISYLLRGYKRTLDAQRGEKALAAIDPFLERIKKSDIRPLNIKPARAVSVGLNYAALFEKDRRLFEESFKQKAVDLVALGDIEDRALGLWHAAILAKNAGILPEPLDGMLAESRTLRAKLQRSAEYVWSGNPALMKSVRRLRGVRGHRNKADALHVLAVMFSEHWKEVERRCAVSQKDISKAQKVSADILKALTGNRKPRLEAAVLKRDRAYEYLCRGIDEIRACAAFVHRNNPKALSSYVPLYPSRKRKKKDQTS